VDQVDDGPRGCSILNVAPAPGALCTARIGEHREHDDAGR
jgi:hypothetical protein